MRVSFLSMSGIILSLFVIMIGFNMSYLRGERPLSVVGIAHATEYQLTIDRNVIVKDVFVSPGSFVKKGQLITTLHSPDLEAKIAQATHTISLLKKEDRSLEGSFSTQSSLLKSNWENNHTALQAEMNVLQAEIALRQQIQSHGADSSSQSDPLMIRLQALKKQLEIEQRVLQSSLDNLRAEYQFKKTHLATDYHRWEFDLHLLTEARKQLMKVAPMDGTVQSVLATNQEEVPAFQPLLTLIPSSPSQVTGYIIQLHKSTLRVGDVVQLSDYTRTSNPARGKVIGFGSIVALPEILQKPSSPKVYGLEVFISIMDESPFFHGEKILIQ